MIAGVIIYDWSFPCYDDAEHAERAGE